ncbi:MAG TPA: hypothetical protein VME43_29655 [Bryobacteraceae bacterium]|nr:hypothetical protein [Bryobacteraceae bacterium]
MIRRLVLLGAAVGWPGAGWGQSTVGVLEGSAAGARGPAAGTRVEIEGVLGSLPAVEADGRGYFSVVLPYGEYTVRAPALGATCRVRIRPLAMARCDLRAGQNRTGGGAVEVPVAAFNAAQYLLEQVPGAFRYPLDFANLGGIRLPLVSGESVSWTADRFRLNGLDATDSYQPGKPVMLDDTAAEDSVVAVEPWSGGGVAVPVDDYMVGVFLAGAESSWHGGLATADTGSGLAGDNLPPLADRGIVERPDEYLWFTRDTADLSGPIGRWADFSATATGQWAYQTAPQRTADVPIGSRMLFANTRGQVRLSRHDRLDALYSGSRLDLTNGGWPSGMEAILANRVMPDFYGVEGFENLRETDHFDLVQAGWTHEFGGSAGALEVRYGYSTAHLDTSPINGANSPSQIDLLDEAPVDAPLSNFAVRTRQQLDGAYRSGEMRWGGMTHSFFATTALESSQPRNRFQTTGGTDLISAAGQPAYVVRLNTPTDTRERIDSLVASAGDSIRWIHGITLALGLGLDVAHGAIGGAPVGISWTSPSPRVGITVPVPHFHRLNLQGSYARTVATLAGRYLDFGDPESLSGLVYSAPNGQLLERFGGAYSSIDAHLRRPYADEFHLGAELALPLRSNFSLNLLRRDEKDRIAAVDTGVTAADYYPVFIDDPGPDFIPGTFDDQSLVVYAQQPATLGQDQYLLTNPAGLRELTEALTAAAGTHHRYADVRLSFTSEKSFGPTNPGSSAWVNDPGVIGALYGDPNSLIHATGHPFMDRAFLGKMEATLPAPRRWGGWRLTNIVNYMDGLPFARELLVTGLPQGPFLVDTTVRGSPEGGNRAQYVLNWNLRLSREMPLRFGGLQIAAVVSNVLNNGNKIEESDLSGPQFNLRPAIALLPARTLRLELHWHF